MIIPDTYTATITRVSDLAINVLPSDKRLSVFYRIHNSLSFFQSATCTTELAMKSVCLEAAYRELGVAVAMVNQYGASKVKGWESVSL